MVTINETLNQIDITEAKADQFAWFRFEHVNTKKLVDALEDKGYDIIGANDGEILIADLNEKMAMEIRSIIWEWNDGAWAEYKMATYDEVEQYL